MATTKDPFSIEIRLLHPSYSPKSISKALSIKPKWSHAVGELFLESPRKWSIFYASLQEGDYASGYERALTKVVSFLKKNEAFWTEFMGGDGEVELILNHTINPQEAKGDKCFELDLSPEFLGHLSSRSIGLRVQGWQGSVKRRRSTR
jgi:hypothetical protein